MVSSLLLLIGLCAAVLLTMVEGAALVWGYLLWLGSLGLLHSLALAGGEARVHGLWPLLAGYSRLIAAACFTQTILVRAIAGRGSAAVPTRRAPAGRRSRWLGSAVQGFLLAILVVVIALIGHLLDLPPLAGPAPGS